MMIELTVAQLYVILETLKDALEDARARGIYLPVVTEAIRTIESRLTIPSSIASPPET